MKKISAIKKLPFHLPNGWDVYFYRNPDDFNSIQNIEINGNNHYDIYGQLKKRHKKNKVVRVSKVCKIFKTGEAVAFLLPIQAMAGALLTIAYKPTFFILVVLSIWYYKLIK